jgi:cell division protein FtsQ
VLRDDRRVEWGSAEDSAEKAGVLVALLEAREARVYDVSVPGQPVTSDVVR